jgi:hypothetical protein
VGFAGIENRIVKGLDQNNRFTVIKVRNGGLRSSTICSTGGSQMRKPGTLTSTTFRWVSASGPESLLVWLEPARAIKISESVSESAALQADLSMHGLVSSWRANLSLSSTSMPDRNFCSSSSVRVGRPVGRSTHPKQ